MSATAVAIGPTCDAGFNGGEPALTAVDDVGSVAFLCGDYSPARYTCRRRRGRLDGRIGRCSDNPDLVFDDDLTPGVRGHE